jgi:[acyl-carrier-protein] S-malonyltransferase
MSGYALMFPGQGSQSVGMLGEIASKHPIIKDTFLEASQSLGYSLWDLVQFGPEDKLNQTEYTQAAVLTADVSLFRLFAKQNKISASMMAGHSLGEYAALVCADAIDLADAVKLVSTRGRLMQEDIPLGLGAMAAIVGLSDNQVIDICNNASSDIELVGPANYNAIGQVVIAGNTAAVNRAILLAQELGARLAKIIPVSVPCHCELLRKTADKFLDVLQEYSFKTPAMPVISNVDLSVYESSEQIVELLARQLYSPVQWVKTIQHMKNSGISKVIECGPGKVLSGLVKRIDNTLAVESAIIG